MSNQVDCLTTFRLGTRECKLHDLLNCDLVLERTEKAFDERRFAIPTRARNASAASRIPHAVSPSQRSAEVVEASKHAELNRLFEPRGKPAYSAIREEKRDSHETRRKSYETDKPRRFCEGIWRLLSPFFFSERRQKQFEQKSKRSLDYQRD